MMMKLDRWMRAMMIGAGACALALAGCGGEESEPAGTSTEAEQHEHADDGHAHAEGDHAPDESMGGEHAHEETPLGTAMVGEHEVEFAQGHGSVEPGRESHLVVKLPYTDHGATVVRAWIGTEDRFESVVAKGEYAPSHDDYDVHAVAPDPLPENATWWVEIEKPSGEKLVGSIDFE